MNRLFSKIAPKSNLLLSTNTYCKILSARNQTAVNIPSNLKLVHENVIHEEIKKDAKIFSKDLYMFPQLLSQIPSSIPVTIFNAGGKYTEQPAHIEKKIFGVAIRKDIVHEVIRYQRHKARQPKKTKRMSEISGSNKKPRPQKGGGQSQAGHKRNSVWRGGQKAHGPVLRDYSISLNRKFRAMGMMIVLAAKLREGNLVVFDKIECETHKTKELTKILSSHGLNDTTVLIVDDEMQDNFLMAITNLVSATPLIQQKLNVYDIMKREKLAISLSAFKKLQERVMMQYTHKGKLHGLTRDLNTYKLAAALDDDDE